MAQVHLRIYRPLGNASRMGDLTLDTEATQISWTYTLPGGANTLEVGAVPSEQRRQWGQHLGFIPSAIQIAPFSHVEAVVNGVIVWEGRIVEEVIGPLGVQGFVAEGYGLTAANDDVYESTSAVAATTGDIISDIIIAAAPQLGQGNADEFLDPEVSHTRAEFDGMTLAVALDQVIREGGNGYVEWDWWVTSPGRRVVLLPRTPPSTPHYRIAYDPEIVDIRRNYRNLYGSAWVSYTSQGVEFETSVATDPSFASQWGISRRLRIPADELSSTAAEQLRDIELARRFSPDTSITIDLATGEMLRGMHGAPIPSYLIQAGQWVQVANLDPQIVTNVRYDAKTDAASLELARASWSRFDVYLATTCEEVTKLSIGVNPKTGGRRRGIRQVAAVNTLTDSTGVAADGTLAALSGTTWNATQRDIVAGNVADLNAKLNEIRTALRNAKILP